MPAGTIGDAHFLACEWCFPWEDLVSYWGIQDTGTADLPWADPTGRFWWPCLQGTWMICNKDKAILSWRFSGKMMGQYSGTLGPLHQRASHLATQQRNYTGALSLFSRSLNQINGICIAKEVNTLQRWKMSEQFPAWACQLWLSESTSTVKDVQSFGIL